MGSPYQRISRTRVAKTKTFSGCWTCRQRKVKCDLKKPECHRCLKAGRNCEGYSLLLHWIDNESGKPPIRPTAIKRKAMISPRFPAWKLRMHQVDELLAQIDAQGDQVDKDTGPFSVFQASACSSPGKDQTEICRYKIQTGTNLSSPSSGTFSYSPFISDLYGSPHLTLGLQWSIFPSTVPISNKWPVAAKLFHHYVANVTDLLRPFLHNGNFYGAVYVPRAIIGAESLFQYQSSNSWGIPSWGNQSIFYSLLSTAAFHLRGIKSSDRSVQSQSTQSMDNIGKFCRMMAYRYLRTAITEPINDVEELHTVMSATLSLITIDIMEGGMSEYWLHLKGFKRLQDLSDCLHPSSQVHFGETEGYLKTVFYCQSTLSQSTDCIRAPLPWPSHPIEGAVAYESIDNHCLQNTYGVTYTLLCFINDIATLYQHILYYLSRGLSLPDGLERARVTLGENILIWNIRNEESVLFDDKEQSILTAKIMSLHILAFAYAVRVFYITHLVLPVDPGALGNSGTGEKLRHQVLRVAYCLQMIEAIKRSNPDVFRKPMAPILWPGFIASCEAEPRDREEWLEWWRGMLRYQIGNIQPLWNTVQETWRARDEGSFGIGGSDRVDGNHQGYSHRLPLWRGLLRDRQAMIFAL